MVLGLALAPREQREVAVENTPTTTPENRVPAPASENRALPPQAVNARVYWDRFRETATPNKKAESSASRFGWTQYADHGPGEELLGDPATVLDLGCGVGYEVSFLRRQGIDATGLDTSGTSLAKAREMWPDVPAERFVHADAIEYLSTTERTWDAVYSIFGAVWFHDPNQLLPLLRRRLSPGGALVFAHFPPVPGCLGVSGAWGFVEQGQTPMYVKRWHYPPETWTEMLASHGFRATRAEILPGPGAGDLGTLLVQAR